jgi:GH15 family glucan-1,4-alpha-glucosidase
MNDGFLPLKAPQDYFPIEDHGLIGDGKTAGLVRRDGAVVWLCLPRFDSAPLFCSILDARRGGCFRICCQDASASRQFYEPDTGVLHTEMRTARGVVRLTDALTLHCGANLAEDAAAARHELLRIVKALEGEAVVIVEFTPRGPHRAEPAGGGLDVVCAERPDLHLHLSATVSLQGLRAKFPLRAGESAALLLRWSGGSPRYRAFSPEQNLAQTVDAWQRWMRHFRYSGPQQELVGARRSL